MDFPVFHGKRSMCRTVVDFNQCMKTIVFLIIFGGLAPPYPRESS